MDAAKELEPNKLLKLLTDSNMFLREENTRMFQEFKKLTAQFNFFCQESEQRWEVCVEIFKKEGYKITYSKDGKLDG